MKPILFNTEMVKATIEDRKTTTRKLVRPQFPTYQDREPGRFSKIEQYGRAAFIGTHAERPNMRTIINPPYLSGDILYVRETWSKRLSNECYAQPCHGGVCPYESCESTEGPCFPKEYIYKATDSLPSYGGKWHPSIHMPKEAARIFLRVTDVRAERLWESFGDGDGQAERFQQEGITLPEECTNCIEAYGYPCCSDLDDSLPYDEQTGEDSEGGSECGMLDEVRNDFAVLWDSTIKAEKLALCGWAANPWVWVIEYERCEKPEEE